MDDLLEKDARVLWSFWLACALAVTGGVAPLVLASGGPNRLAGAIIPYLVAAAASAANALMWRRGKSLATALYFLAGVAIVYGMLLMFAVPLRLAVTGTCPDPPAVCPAGLERGFSTGETTGFTLAVLMGVLSILAGFLGLMLLYRRKPKWQATSPPPMERVIPARNQPSAPLAEAATKTVVEPVPETSGSEPSTTPPSSSSP
jgi:4-amino-4-deoxy-L-arabinose transferase-like glycosyltransferase